MRKDAAHRADDHQVIFERELIGLNPLREHAPRLEPRFGHGEKFLREQIRHAGQPRIRRRGNHHVELLLAAVQRRPPVAEHHRQTGPTVDLFVAQTTVRRRLGY